MEGPCWKSSPLSLMNCGLGVVNVTMLIIMRASSPLYFDSWREALEHLPSVWGPPFSLELCAICLADLEPGEDVCRTPCGHDFHRICLEDWVWTRGHMCAECPLCREGLVVPNVTHQGSADPLLQ
mmetsp:Transcript_76764/g.199923  ORF Transcript_76764/g.199923 Transcript_76764/m.199923 type:complete len:125 (-) Transcript_76764:13-387(-)